MFRKLLRYELRSCVKKLGGLWIAAAVMFAINSVLLNVVDFSDSTLSSLTFMISGMMLYLTSMALVIMSFVFIVTRFYKGMTGSEGYLMFTLPVKTHSLILSKLTAAVIVQLVSGVVAAVPSVISSLFGSFDFAEVAQIFVDMYADIGIEGTTFVVLLLPIALVCVIEQIMRIYFSIAMGHRSKKRRVLWSIVAYMVTNYAISFIAAILLTVSITGCALLEDLDTLTVLYCAEAGVFLFMAAVTVAEFFAVRHIFDKQLNLE